MPNNVADNTNSALNNQGAAGQICILGLGVTGLAVARYFLAKEQPLSLTIYAEEQSKRNEANINSLLQQFFPQQLVEMPAGQEKDGLGLSTGSGSNCKELRVRIGAEAVDRCFDLCVASPGIRPDNPLYQSALQNSAELIGEPELAYRISPRRWLAITGTNGKTTTTRLLDRLLEAGGLRSSVAGNIGPTLIDAVFRRQPDEYLVVELSSYQLATATSIAPEAAILLNITPDHIGWHGSFEAYRQTKLRIFKWMPLDAPVLIDGVSQIGREIIGSCLDEGRRVIGLGLSPGQADAEFGLGRLQEMAWVDAQGWLRLRLAGQDQAIMPANGLQIIGFHNCLNALAASAIAADLGVQAADLARGLAGFQPLEHRIEALGDIAEVSYYNDSKATNPEATVMALSAFPDRPVILLLGGEDKNTALEELIARALEHCRLVICYGAAARRFYEAFDAVDPGRSGCQLLQAGGMREAFQAAVDASLPGDIVLLSPSCSSFDEFDSFEDRGRVFKLMVAEQAAMGQR